MPLKSIRHVLMLSGGAGSYGAGQRLRDRGVSHLHCLFADTLIEDDDTYRFLVESAADLLGVKKSGWAHLKTLLESIPDIRLPKERASHLKRLSAEAMNAIPRLHWVQDGRNPWEVFKDTRFLGNSRLAKCSHVLKQDQCRKWLEENCDVDRTVLHLGIHWSEKERFSGNAKKPGAKELWLPWKCEAPLCEPPLKPASEFMTDLDKAGIARPRLYQMGFSHNNCGGFCVRGGHAHFNNLLEHLPDRYAYHEQQEQKLREYLDADVAILRDRRGGVLTPLTMADFRDMNETGEQVDLFDWGACGCFVSSRDDSSG